MKKIGIIASGGGMSCAYSVGVILALVDKYNFTNPYLVIGGSGSTGTLSYYVAGQYKEVKNIWENLLSTKKFVSFVRPTRIMDIDYLIDEVFKKQEPLNTEKISKSNIKFLIAVTNIETGKLEYFSNKEGVDIFELLRASSAIPIAFNKTVTIQHKEYIDGGMGNSFYSHIDKAKQEGADVLIAIDSTNHGKFGDFLVKIWSFFQRKSFRQGFNVHSLKLNNYPELIQIKPTIPLPTTTLDNKREHILKSISIGYNDLLDNKEVEALFILNRSSNIIH